MEIEQMTLRDLRRAIPKNEISFPAENLASPATFAWAPTWCSSRLRLPTTAVRPCRRLQARNSRYSQRALMRATLEADVQVYTILVTDSLAAAPANAVPLRPGLIRKP